MNKDTFVEKHLYWFIWLSMVAILGIYSAIGMIS